MAMAPTVPALPQQTARPPLWLALWRRLGRDTVERLSWLGVLAVGAVVVVNRAKFVLLAHPPSQFVWSDMQGYVDRAWRLAQPGVQLNRFDTFYPPGTHVLMAPLFRMAGSRDAGMQANQYLWLVLAVVTLWAVGALAYKLFGHPLAAVVAMLLLMGHAPFTVFTGFFMSESPFAAFMAVSLWLGLVARDMDTGRPWRRACVYAVAGLVAGLAASIRPQFLFGAMTIGFPLLHRRFPFVRLREATALAIMFALPCLASIGLNRHASGVKMGMSGNAGFNFFQGHCDVVHVETHSADGGGWYAFAAPVRIQRVQREGKPEKKVVIRGHMAWENDYFFAEGFKCIRQDGLAHLRRTYANVEDLFSPADPWPPNSGRFAVASNWSNHVYCHALLLMLFPVLLLSRFRWAERWLLLQMLTLMPVGLLFYGDSRYRVPYDMFGMLMVAGLVTAMLRLRRDPRRVPGVGWRKHPEG